MIYLTSILGLTTASLILYLVRKDRLSVGYSLWWLAIALGLIILGLCPKLVDWIGGALGISYPPTLLLIVALCLVLVKLLHMDIERTRQQREIRILSQRLAVAEGASQKRNNSSE